MPGASENPKLPIGERRMHNASVGMLLSPGSPVQVALQCVAGGRRPAGGWKVVQQQGSRRMLTGIVQAHLCKHLPEAAPPVQTPCSQFIEVLATFPLRVLLSARLARALQPHHHTHAVRQRLLRHSHQLVHLTGVEEEGRGQQM